MVLYPIIKINAISLAFSPRPCIDLRGLLSPAAENAFEGITSTLWIRMNPEWF